MSMEEYLKSVSYILLIRERRNKQDELANEREASAFFQVAGSLSWTGKATSPATSLAGSILQQKVCKLRVSDVINANVMLK